MAENTISVSCKKANLKRIRTFVADMLEPYALADVLNNQLILAVDEISANFIIHSNHEDESKQIRVGFTSKGRQLIFEISDEGAAFSPDNYHEPVLRDLILQGRKGGVGILLVNRIMDKVEYLRKGNRNICRMYKTV